MNRDAIWTAVIYDTSRRAKYGGHILLLLPLLLLDPPTHRWSVNSWLLSGLVHNRNEFDAFIPALNIISNATRSCTLYSIANHIYM